MKNLPFDSVSLKKWFKKAKRKLPWRDNPSPYAVWISEVMLQQTQVAVVIDYYLRWMERFPTIEALASASVDDVIKMWEGLGYYSRARYLHEGAQYLLKHHGAKLPDTKEGLSAVKGLGPYTTGAILSLAFQQKAAALDGNVMRVLTRYFAITEDIQKTATLKKLWEIADAILPEEEPWVVVEGLIELGALICKREPNCPECPLRPGCQAYWKNIQTELPKKGKKETTTALSRKVFVVVYQDELLVRKEPKGKVMADLYQFPFVEHPHQDFQLPLRAREVKKLRIVQHSYTRYRVKLYPFLWEALEKMKLAGYEWVSWKNIHLYPFSSGHKKILKELGNAFFTH
jgi:A/G-specific adenine glycosylase